MEKITLNLEIEENAKTNKMKLEFVNYYSQQEIAGCLKLVGRVVGDKNKIVFGVRRANRAMVFQIYDFKKVGTLDFMVTNGYAFLTCEQKFNIDRSLKEQDLTEDMVDYTQYGWTYPVDIKTETEEISTEEYDKIYEEISVDYTNQTSMLKEVVDEGVIAVEHDYFTSIVNVMHEQYKDTTVPLLTALMDEYRILPKIKNNAITKLIKKVVIDENRTDKLRRKFSQTLVGLPVEEIDELYDAVITEVKNNAIFDEYEDIVAIYLKKIAEIDSDTNNV